MKISGFSIIRNGEKLGYPYVESICSVLPLCDEFVIAIGNSDDETRNKILAINSPKIKIIDTVWNESLREGGRILAQQTDVAFHGITGDWGFYIQGDEVLHEKYLETVRKAMELYKDQSEVEGLLFNYKHFYGSYEYVGSSMRWYRREIRVVRNDKRIHSYKDAQGFRKDGKKLNAKHIDAEIYHYGWCRPPKEQQLKQFDFNKLYHDDNWVSQHVVSAEEYDYTTFDKLEKFEGTHPKVMLERINKSNFTFNYDPSKIRIRLKDRIRVFVEKLTSYRIWEYRNYRIL
jgi:hypothetical protein